MDETLSGKPASQRKRTRTSQDDPYEFDSSSQPATASGATKRSRRTPATQDSSVAEPSQASESVPMEDEEPASITEERFNLFKKSLTGLFRESRAQSLPMARFREHLTEQFAGRLFKSAEIRAAFERMTDANQIMVADDIIFLI